ncbi:MAG: AI-2E family transporter [Candidatus Magasanikbacteria bacterium]|jgi:predicted PurR-regulated permease PerM|nr:AI-2E family transporter [Candidatus Magasanikbacteria bacterium]
MTEDRVIHISTATILKVCALFFSLYIVYVVWDLLLLLFVSLIFAALIDPFAHKLAKKKIPRGVAVVIIYAVILGILGLTVSVLFPVIARDLPQVLEQVGGAAQDLQQQDWWQPVFGEESALRQQLLGDGNTSAFERAYSALQNWFGGVFSFVLVLVMTFYLVVQDDPIRKILTSVLPHKHIPLVEGVIKKIRASLSAWVRAQFILSVIVGVMVFIGLSILQIQYAAVIALLAALFEFIPYIGPIFAAIPALLLGFLQGGPILFLLVLALYVVVQQLENHVLVPKIMQHAVGLNPIVSIIAVIAGAELAGILGALIAIPVATVIRVILQEILARRSEQLE